MPTTRAPTTRAPTTTSRQTTATPTTTAKKTTTDKKSNTKLIVRITVGFLILTIIVLFILYQKISLFAK